MRLLATAILVLMPGVCSAYIQPSGDILAKMSTQIQRAKTVQASVVLEDPDGHILQQNIVNIPMRPGEEPVGRREALLAGYLPFKFLTTGREDLKSILPSLFADDSAASYTRFGGAVCYLLEGRKARLWIRKKDLFPMQAAVLTEEGTWITSLYLDPVALSRRIAYPSRTEVRKDKDLEFMELLSIPGQNVPSP